MRQTLIVALLLAACGGTPKDSADTADTSDSGAGRYHPDGWSDPTQHGPAAKFQDLTCTACHGADLTGGSADQSCDTCHTSGWRTDCVFCHGGTADTTGAPPLDIDGLATGLSFPEHTAHVTGALHAAWDCEQCHVKPTDVLMDGHLFVGDVTKRIAEVSFDGGLSTGGAYAGAGSCANLYCHGNGAGILGSATSGTSLDCGGCHGSATDPATLSGVHPDHLAAGATCGECHAATATGNETVSGPDHHVNGAIDTEFPSGMVFDGATCTGICHDVEHNGSSWTGGAYHPAGWDAPDQHGVSANLQTDDCTACHGVDLAGGTSGVGCDTCHASGWRTECTYCHGGDENTTGAPPVDMDGRSTSISFPEHSAHVEETNHAAWDCVQCHARPTDVLTSGHIFIGDTTPGVAELTFASGLSPAAAYAGSGSCANLYCHGDGAGTLGSVTSGESLDCGSCHGSAASPGTLSAVHAQHLLDGATCGECHSATATGNDTITGPALHVDGNADTAFPSGMVFNGVTCTGTCHAIEHNGSSWTGGAYHPAGWDAGDVHGPAADLQTQDCTTCHGADLTGGSAAVSCDSCHAAGWRTECTYCHGGAENTTGAPPVDMDGLATSISFPEHAAHVEATNHTAWDCVQCHVKPTDVLSSGHIFVGDTTPGAAELTFVAGLSPAATYAGSGSCANLYCHGNGAGTLGSVTTGDSLDCGGCHGSAASASTLSAVHPEHLGEGAVCGDCHSTTATGNDAISGPDQHVDGEIDTAFPSGMVYDGTTCTGTCHGVDHDASGWSAGAFHPTGWDASDVHGPVANLQEQDCTTCHGADLSGGTSGTSCDSCHAADWRTDCVYCHGGTDNTTGAPPVDIDGSATFLTFAEHTAHVEENDHAAWGCEQCHATPDDVLSAGHVYVGDTTPGVSEVGFIDGLAPDGAYTGGGSCDNLYCHGNGAGVLGSASTGDTLDCASCHGSATDPGTLSTVHPNHLSEGATCEECHAATASGSDAIADPIPHVDGNVDVAFTSPMVMSAGSCTGTCHGVEHNGSTWTDGGFHPVGWDAADQHGIVANLQQQDCTTCHGADLAGGTSGTDCDTCHRAGWRTECTYCHGGTDNATGAPPVDMDGRSTALSFADHSAHVEEMDHAAWDCTQCHAKPTDVLTRGHVFIGDSTPGAAELTFAVGLSPAGTYGGSGSCANLYCHGNGAAVLGSVRAGDTLDCGSCHGSVTRPGTLSTVHPNHLSEGATCEECHSATASGSTAISAPAQHVDGNVDVAFTSAIVMSGGTCTGTCHGVAHDRSTWVIGGFHPSGWDASDVHGLAANLKTQDCTTCHGTDLNGGTSGESCDSCHVAGWRTNCTYCHGGTDNATGAPPVDMDGSGTSLSFPEHSIHVEEMDHLAYDCVECHTKPTDVLSTGHLFIGDTTAAAAELSFAAGLSSAGTYGGRGSCSNLYCHGNGNGRLGSVTTGASLTCGSCHGTATSPGGMSGRHDDHFDREVGAGCADCHATTVSNNTTILDPALHVNGTADMSFPTGMVYTAGRCTGTCHGEIHTRESW